MKAGESLQKNLSAHFGEDCVRPADYARSGFHLRLDLQKEQIRELAQLLYNAGCWLEYITAVDRRDYLEVIYVYGQYLELCRVQALVRISKSEQVTSISRIFPTADWHEREVYDFFGLVFIDHPNLKRILLPEDADYHPLLKDFKAPVCLNGEKGPSRAC